MKVNLFESQSETPIRLVIPEEQVLEICIIVYREKYFTFTSYSGNHHARFDEVNPPVDFSEFPDLAS